MQMYGENTENCEDVEFCSNAQQQECDYEEFDDEVDDAYEM